MELSVLMNSNWCVCVCIHYILPPAALRVVKRHQRLTAKINHRATCQPCRAGTVTPHTRTHTHPLCTQQDVLYLLCMGFLCIYFFLGGGGGWIHITIGIIIQMMMMRACSSSLCWFFSWKEREGIGICFFE